MKCALITGASGFLGKILLKNMIGLYEDIYIIGRNTKVLYILKNHYNATITKIHVKKIDISERDQLVSLFSIVKFDIVYHAAAKVGSIPSDPNEGYTQTNIDGTKNICDMVLKYNVDRLIYTSSFFALGETGGDIKDENWNNKSNFAHPYITTKFDAGQLVDYYKINHNLPVIIIIPTTIIGVGMDNPLSKLIIDYLSNKLLGLPNKGKSRLNFVTVNSVAQGHILAATFGKIGEKYILGGKNMQLNEFLNLFGRKYGIKPVRSIPFFIIYIYALFQRFNKNPEITTQDLNVSVRNYTYSSNKAIASINYIYEDIERVIDDIISDYFSRGLINIDKIKS